MIGKTEGAPHPIGDLAVDAGLLRNLGLVVAGTAGNEQPVRREQREPAFLLGSTDLVGGGA